MSGKIAIVMGSDSDLAVMQQAADTLKEFGVEFEMRIMSAHRTPDDAAEFSRHARKNGFSAIIAGAGMAAHLAGVLAGHTTLPVIGVPLKSGPLNGQDALYATVQMPPGVPVATMAIDGAKNAALFAVQMLSLSDKNLAAKLDDYKKSMADGVRKKNAALK